MIIGNTTEEFTLLAACDGVYLWKYSKGLVASSALAGNNLHLHVTNPSELDLKYVDYLKEVYKNLSIKKSSITSSYDTLPIAHYTEDQKRCFYACNRFIVAPEIVKGDVLILDIDSLILRRIDNFREDIGLYFRTGAVIHTGVPHWGKKAKRVMAGSVYCKFKNLDFMKDVKEFILRNEMIWHVDQVALWMAYKNFKNLVRCKPFDNKFLDWHFKDDTSIWSGKHTSKDSNKTYMRKYREFVNQIEIKEEDYLV